MKILVCGSRHWAKRQPIATRLSFFNVNEHHTIIEGGAPGADTVARSVALKLGFDVITLWANWERDGKAAGPIRNRKMLSMKPDLVLAFHEDLSKSKGTADTVREAQRLGIKVEVHSS
jgi:hypothetical protein